MLSFLTYRGVMWRGGYVVVSDLQRRDVERRLCCRF